MKCEGCGALDAARVRIGINEDGTKWEVCDICGKIPAVWLPDVYLGSKGGVKTDENLCDRQGKPIPFHTKREKSAIMKMLGLQQAPQAEHHHGHRNEEYLHKRKYII
jgi:hypothetical protein